MKTKKILAFLLAAVLVFAFAACESKDAAKTIQSPDDFEGAKISVQTATTAHDNIQEMLDEGKNIEVMPYEKITQCFDDLELGRVDAVYVDSVVAGYYLTGDTKFQKVWTSDDGEPIGVCLKKGNEDMAELVNTAIDMLYYNGTMASLSEKHFGSASDVEGVRTVTEEPVLDLSKLNLVKDGTLTVGFEAGYPPMEYADESGLEYIGFDVDLAKELADLLGLEVEYVNTAWDGIFAGLDKDQYDVVISAVSITPDRQTNYCMTDPYVANALVIVTMK